MAKKHAMHASCSIHGVVLVCPACLGGKGGAVSSPAKTRAARRNAKRPRPNARGPRTDPNGVEAEA